MLPTDIGELALLVGGLFVAAIAFGYGLTELRTAYRMHGMETLTVASVANRPGPVEIEGIVSSSGKTLTAPFTDTECVVYEYTIEELRRDHDDDGRKWKTVDSGGERVPFRIADDTGSILVEPAGATLRLDSERVFRSREGEESPDAVGGAFSLNLSGVTINAGRDRRYTERRIDAGERVYVFGPARYDPGASAAAGEVNAIVGRAGERGVFGRLTDRMLGRSLFLLADGDERAALSRVLKSALFAGIFGAIALVVVLAILLVR